VSEGTVPGIDPRFDPRFQRGYVSDADAPVPMPDTREAPLAATTTPAQPAPPAAPAQPAPPARVAEADDPAAAIHGLLAHAETRRLTRPGREPDDSAEGHSAHGAAAGDDPAEVESAFTRVASRGSEPEPAPDTSPTRWLWTAIGACVSFVVLGSVLFWVQASDPATFLGSRAGIDETVRAIVSALSPALVQAGVLGVVVVLVIWAVRGRRRPSEEPR
jgi:hypothetical protein